MNAVVLKKVLGEPLVHFFVLGAVLFGVYGMLNRGSHAAPDEILVSRGQLNNLQLQFERVWQRPATPVEMQALIDNWVKEEILYREGVMLGLDRDDAVVRRRIGQKLAFIVESAAPPSPTDTELQAWLESHPGQYQIPAIYSLRQVYFDPTRHTDFPAFIAAAKRSLAAGNEVEGDPTLLPAGMDAVTATELRRVFGDDLSKRLQSLPAGSWEGPFPSAFGAHLVFVTLHGPARRATLAEVRAEVERDLMQEQLRKANADFYERLRAKYFVRVEGADGAADPAS